MANNILMVRQKYVRTVFPKHEIDYTSTGLPLLTFSLGIHTIPIS